MKKTLLTSVMLAAAVFTFCAVNSTPANATCPAKKDCVQEAKMPPHHPQHCFKPMPPAEHAKLMEAKKAEFEARLKLTEEQKTKIEELKAAEKKSLKSCRAKIKKEQEKLDKLVAQEMETRAENVKKFEAILTEEQKAELKKMHEEMMAEKAKFVPCSCDCGCPACQKHHEEMKVRHHGPHGPAAPEFAPGPKEPGNEPEVKAPEAVTAPEATEPAPEQPAAEPTAPAVEETTAPAAPVTK